MTYKSDQYNEVNNGAKLMCVLDMNRLHRQVIITGIETGNETEWNGTEWSLFLKSANEFLS